MDLTRAFVIFEPSRVCLSISALYHGRQQGHVCHRVRTRNYCHWLRPFCKHHVNGVDEPMQPASAVVKQTVNGDSVDSRAHSVPAPARAA